MQRAINRGIVVSNLTRPKKNFKLLEALKQLRELNLMKQKLKMMSSFKQGPDPKIQMLQNEIEMSIKSNINNKRVRATKIDRIQRAQPIDASCNARSRKCS